MKEISKEYQFNKDGEHQVRFELHEERERGREIYIYIYLFKDVKNLHSIEMNSNKSEKILSMKSVFEN